MYRLRFLFFLVIAFLSFAFAAPQHAQKRILPQDNIKQYDPSPLCVTNVMGDASEIAQLAGPVIGPCDPQDLVTPTAGFSKVKVSSPSAGLIFNLTFDDAAMSAAGLSAGDITNVHNACAYAANQFR